MTQSITGKVWVFGDDLNTDAMYPAFAMKMDPPEAAKHIFYEVRPGWTDQVSPGDIVVAGENAFVYDTGNDAELAADLDALSEDPELRARMGRRSLELVAANGRRPPEETKRAGEDRPEKRLFQVDEVAHAVAMLCADEASGINGQAISICGPEVLR